MRAIVFSGTLQYERHRPDPVPADGEALVRVRMAGVCATDLHILRGYLNFRGVLGHEFVGTVEAGSPRWLGRRVVGEINCVCRKCDMCLGGLANHCRNRTVTGIAGRDGCFADFVAVPERNLHEVPVAVSDEEAVFVEPLAAAYQVLSQCPIDGRMNVSVVGTGRLGLLVIQVLKTAGCRLTAVGRNPRTMRFCEQHGVQALSADEVGAPRDRDVVVECTGSPDGLASAMRLVRPRGTIVLKSTYADSTPGSLNLAPIVVDEVKVIGSRCGPFPEAISALARKDVEVRPMVSRVVPLDEGIAAIEASDRSDCVKALIRMM